LNDPNDLVGRYPSEIVEPVQHHLDLVRRRIGVQGWTTGSDNQRRHRSWQRRQHSRQLEITGRQSEVIGEWPRSLCFLRRGTRLPDRHLFTCTALTISPTSCARGGCGRLPRLGRGPPARSALHESVGSRSTSPSEARPRHSCR
jgi:hypothetical protein